MAKAVSRWRPIEAPNGKMADADLFPGCFVLVTCKACGHFKAYPPATVVLRLRQLQMGGTLATFAEVAGRVGATCPCGARDWRAGLAWPPGMTDGDIKRLAARARN
ncbi:hypothetical protein [Phenylobacterium sp.]|uniref:hypothetical protein n=1 Tax=Phenylobacterium sp. TaxID=1871053 RepID=UPI002F3E3787